jgi:hypothetical protein
MRIAPWAGLALLTWAIGCGGGGNSSESGAGSGNPGSGGGTIVADCGSGTPTPASNQPLWAQWGANPQHTGAVNVAAQGVVHKLADITYDPFVEQEKAENTTLFGGEAVLTVHEQAPLTDGNDVYMEKKFGSYTSCNPVGAWTGGAPCGPNAWNSMNWCEARFSWVGGALTQQWGFASDWKPEPNGSYNGVPGFFSAGLINWEPVFQPALANGFIYVPGAGGTLWKVDKNTGAAVSHLNPFAGLSGVVATNTYVSGPLTADSSGNIFFNVIQFADPDTGNIWQNDIVNAWLVKIAPDDAASVVTYSSLMGATASGSQRPGINVAPAIAADGTLYTSSRGHLSAIASYLISVNTQTMSANWVTTLSSGGAGTIVDEASSSPTALPDGSVAYGVLIDQNFGSGRTLHFDVGGKFLNSYGFGWDETPAVWAHDGTYSLVLKDNTLSGLFMTQLDADLNIEWRFQNTTIDDQHPNGYEWCVNMAAIDTSGNVFANSEDGSLYAIQQGHTGVFSTPLGKTFLDVSLGAAYTPLSIGLDGRIYTQNNGHLIVVGN